MKLLNIELLAVMCFLKEGHPLNKNNAAAVYKFDKCMQQIRLLIIQGFSFMFLVKMFKIPDFTLESLINCPIDDLKLLNVGTNLTSLEIPNGEILTVNDFKQLFTKFTNLRSLVVRDYVQLNAIIKWNHLYLI